jgi:hypothetical protein
MLPWRTGRRDHPDVTQPRQFPRFAVEAAVTLALADGTTVQGRTENLSRGGLCAMIDELVAPGQRVDCEIALLFDNDSLSESLRLAARVVWCTAFEKRFQVGLSFLPIKAEQAKFLDVFLKFLSPGK